MALQIILTEDVPSVGDVGEVLNVKPGFARNYLLPRGLALLASSKNRRQFEHQKKTVGFKAIKAREAATAIAKRLEGVSLDFARKVGEQDKLFGSVTSIDIEQALADKGIEIDRRRIRLSDPIKALGDYKVSIKLQAELAAEISVTVSAEAAE